jgi:hypothetical protein
MQTYGVVWREGEKDEPLARGSLALFPRGVSLAGMTGLLPVGRTVRYADLAGIRVARAPAERIGGRPSLVLERRFGRPISIASVGEPGALTELAERLGALQLDHETRRTAVVVPLRPDSELEVQALLAHGPPFDPEKIGLDSHEVFLARDEVVFVFESSYGTAAIESLLADPGFLERAGAWHEYIAGPPRIATQIYAWETEDSEPDLFLVPPGLR